MANPVDAGMNVDAERRLIVIGFDRPVSGIGLKRDEAIAWIELLFEYTMKLRELPDGQKEHGCFEEGGDGQ